MVICPLPSLECDPLEVLPLLITKKINKGEMEVCHLVQVQLC